MFHAQVRLFNPEGRTADGALFVDPAGLAWQQVSYLEPSECGCTGESMCRGCVASWEIDHEVVTPSWI